MAGRLYYYPKLSPGNSVHRGCARGSAVYIYIYICGFKAGGAPACRPASCAAFGSWSWSCSWSWFWSWRFGLMFGGAPGVRRQHFEPRLPEPVPGSGPGPGHCFFGTFWGCARGYTVYIYIYAVSQAFCLGVRQGIRRIYIYIYIYVKNRPVFRRWGCASVCAVYIYIYIYICIYTCIYICIHMCIYIYLSIAL